MSTTDEGLNCFIILPIVATHILYEEDNTSRANSLYFHVPYMSASTKTITSLTITSTFILKWQATSNAYTLFFFLSNILAMPFLINAPCQSEFFSWLGNCWYFADQTNYTVVSLVRANYNLWRVTIWLLTVINQTIFLNHMAVFIQWEYKKKK